ncbi:hypothetical protein ERO13_A01G110200v2 [Gossypium hirsutum]|uniref:Probable serine/threonine-protein kinase PIX7 isoform X2 n=1 Tax=Gossypium hirsutum TaxID=3635 RepID=A0A1U8KQG7_GOSHI|nr:probable serine/threonine-protein kinase PIX7 isoform X2 [Gossypium hirsutum]KAG4214262.1 hypothetical protein ERO13_A01G110200v2 [Gossypium hirsutum]
MVIKKEITASSKQVAHHGELVKSALFPKDLVSIYVFSDTDLNLLRARMTKECRKTRREFNRVKRYNLSYTSSQTSSRGKVIKKIAKRCAAMAVFVRRNPEETLWRWMSNASCSVKRLLPISALLGVDKREIILEILAVHHLQGFRLNLTSQLYLNNISASLRYADQEPGSEEAESPVYRTISDVASDDIGGLQEDNSIPNHNGKTVLLNSISIIRRELPEPCLGWPLLRRKSPANQEFKKHEDRDTSVVEWVMGLPNRGTTVVDLIALHSNQTSINAKRNINDSCIENHKAECNAEDSVSSNMKDLEPKSKPGWPLLRITACTTSDSCSEFEDTKMPLPMVERVMNTAIQSKEEDNHVGIEKSLPALRKMPNDLELRCKQFRLRELKQATSGFSPENLIGEGGCSNVYKGFLPSGKPVAVKILKSYKEAWSDFSLEVDIVSSLRHKHITPLIGVCVENGHLISVYDFFPAGSLEEILHGQNKRSVLPWEVRFKMATAVAEALKYLHNECYPHVIHRDVKSSNILLSDDFQPQLSDFGLAILGPMDATNMIDSNAVGTFGYIAPEYFMEGRVSDKIDVYSFGIVLLELLSGRRPISSKAMEKQESLVQWAKALLERRDLSALVDPALDGDFDVAQLHRMVLAATLCLNQSDIHRPKSSQILQILRGEQEPTEGYNLHATYMEVPNNQEDDGHRKLYAYLSVPFSDDDNSTSKCSYSIRRCKTGKKRRLMLKEYLRKGQC